MILPPSSGDSLFQEDRRPLAVARLPIGRSPQLRGQPTRAVSWDPRRESIDDLELLAVIGICRLIVEIAAEDA